MDDNTLLRYSRQIMLPQLDISGQQKIMNGNVLIIGLGGLGSPAALYLAAAGVGRITLVDYDRVDLSNLQRQIAHRTADIGRAKVDSARDAMLAINPGINVSTLEATINPSELSSYVSAFDVVLDASDNFATRFALNAACASARIPLVSGAAIRFEGQVIVFDAKQPDSACYQCVYPNHDDVAESCSATGILAPVVGVIGSLMATEAIKILTNIGGPLVNRMMIYDALRAEWRSIRLTRDPECPICQTNTEHPR